MSALAFLARWSFSKKKPMDAFKHFLQMDAGSSVRQAPHLKERKYIHVEISENFKKQEQSRKQLRLDQLKMKKILLQQKLSTQSKLLGNDKDLENINSEIKSLEDILSIQEKELAKVQNSLENSEGQYLLMEGYKKLVVLNKIEHLKHTSYHPTGLVLHPQTLNIIENIHYLVNNNLPVSKIQKLFEIMPQIFEKEINELDQSMRRLIQQKKLNPETSPSSRIRFFSRHSRRFRDPQQGLIDLDQERQEVFANMEEEIIKMMKPHQPYIELVNSGNTPFRSFYHMVTTFLSSKIHLKLLPEEQELQQTLRKVVDLKQKFHIYAHDIQQKKLKQRYKYIQPPEWIKNHPLLFERYNKSMLRYTNPQPFNIMIPSSNDDGGRAYLQEKLNLMVQEKYDPIFQQLWNSGRRDQLIAMKKKFQIDFLNDSTRILEEYNALQLQEKEKEEFLKIPKKKREIEQKKYSTFKLDDLTKAILINNSNPKKYTLPFFTNYLGIQNEQEARKLFNSFSYLRVQLQQQKSSQLKFEIMKFKD